MSSNTWPSCTCKRVEGVTIGGKKKLLREVQMAGNYQVAKDFDPDDPSQPISAITHTPPGLRVSKGATQARNTLEDPCIQTAMNV